ncbi:hypothetical protein [Paraburkholderia fungorum]|uniref:Uncharacterized protein n=1 Tax=Paraburkholderia fungorum TaxID=134537 RepID=A0AAW3V0U9_9BURK|nr:hypothetical protein [Paraburkholderia fungorum]MBB4517496.1 hypothetical protein [Paraburkholderia fungorum]MBB6204564.1 hypothetical protein [Paraburkholderia fungorum]
MRTHIDVAPIAISAALSGDAEIDPVIDRLKDELETVRQDSKAMLRAQRDRHAIGIAVPRLIGGTRSNSG